MPVPGVSLQTKQSVAQSDVSKSVKKKKNKKRIRRLSCSDSNNIEPKDNPNLNIIM
jgi:hypothetical protein